jgi:hypothetical protein
MEGRIMPITPTVLDLARIEREYGPLPPNATKEQILERYQLAQAGAILRECGYEPTPSGEWRKAENADAMKESETTSGH